MGVLVAGIVAAVALAVVAAVVLRSAQNPVYEVYSTSSVRIGEPGSNLVGPEWTGNPKAGRDERER
jgi:hypothetical protein